MIFFWKAETVQYQSILYYPLLSNKHPIDEKAGSMAFFLSREGFFFFCNQLRFLSFSSTEDSFKTMLLI